MHNEGKYGNATILHAKTVMEMRTTNWIYDGQNGDTDNSLFLAWGLATHIITAKPEKDAIFPGAIMFGHAGDAYGLISDNF